MIKLEVLDKNPLSLEPLIAAKFGIFEKNNVDVSINYVPSFPAFDMTKVTANVGDTTRIFERIASGEELVITSDLTRTMKLVLRDDYKQIKKLKLLAAEDQSLGIYTEFFCQQNNIEFEYLTERSFELRRTMLANHEVDGACMIDPFLIDFIDDGYFIAYEGKNHQHNFTCWAFHREYYDNNPQSVLNFHKSLNEASIYWNNLQPEAKLELANELLVVLPKLDDFYRNLTFNQDQAYSLDALEACYKWKCAKTPGLEGIDLESLLITW